MNHKSWMVHLDERGMILVISLMVLLAMTALGMAVFYSSAVDFKMAGNERSSRVAYYAAQSGLVDAKKRLEDNTPDTTGYAGYCKPGPTGEATIPDSPGCDILDPAWQLPGGMINGILPNGAVYKVSITHTAFFNGTSWIVQRGDESDWWPYYRITSTGTYLNSSKTLEEYTYLDITDTWNKAVISCGDLIIAANGGTDSFDSDSDVYNGTSTQDEGDIYVDGTVSLENNSFFRGSIESTGAITMEQGSKIQGGLTSSATISIGQLTSVRGPVRSSSTASPSISVGNNGNGFWDIVTVNHDVTSAILDPGTRIPIANKVEQTLGDVEPPEACDPEKWLKVKATATNNENSDANMQRNMTGNWDCEQDWAQCVAGGCCRLCPNNVTVRLAGGPDESHPVRYHFDRLTTDQKVKLYTTGYVEIYVNGDIITDTDAVFCGNVGDPANCYVQDSPTFYRPDSPAEEILLYGHGQERDDACNQLGGDLTVKVLNNSHIFAKIYAPDASTTIINNNSHVYGAVVAGGMSFESDGGLNNNAMVHYDAAIANTTARNASIIVENRKECYYGTLTAADTTTGDYYAAGSCKLKF